MNQEDPAPPTIFNIVVDEVVQEVLEEVCRLQEAQHGMGWEAEERNIYLMQMTEGQRGGITSGCRTPWLGR